MSPHSTTTEWGGFGPTNSSPPTERSPISRSGSKKIHETRAAYGMRGGCGSSGTIGTAPEPISIERSRSSRRERACT